MAERQYMKAYGFDKMQEALKSLDLEENKVDCLAMMNKIGQVVKDSAIAKTPVDTGALRKSWFFRTKSSLSVQIYNSQKYAEPVEEGHVTRNDKSFVQGFKMLDKAIIETKNNQIPAIINATLKKIGKGL